MSGCTGWQDVAQQATHVVYLLGLAWIAYRQHVTRSRVADVETVVNEQAGGPPLPLPRGGND